MQLSFSANGAPAAVQDSINTQAKESRGDVVAWPVAAAVRDYVNAQLRGVPADASVSVKVDVSVNLSGIPKKKVVGAVTTVDGTREILDGQPIEGRVESTVAGVPIGEGVQLGGGMLPVSPVERRARSSK